VLVHGYAVSSLYFVPLAARLGRELPVYAVDLPGFGRSDKPPRVLDIPELADALLAWMDAVGIGRADLVGNSLGCTILAAVGARHPERVGRLVLVAPTVEPSARSIGKQLLRLLHDATRERPSLTFLQAGDWLRFGPLRLYRLARYAIADRIEDKLPHVAAPTLVVCGERDTVVSRTWAEEVARLLPNGGLTVLPHAPHAINYSAPEALAALVLSFLRAPAGKGAARSAVSL
jgi:pimeloyl-ACP methyl ester carboxylesterase